ncbi:MAG: peptide-methionine (S)-S-oxide reductase MsrA [Burkholderiaceae bacterium]
MTSKRAWLAPFLLLAATVAIPFSGAATTGEAKAVPAPILDVASVNNSASPQVAVLAGGCFWGVQGVFQHVKGVVSAVSGYAGGDAQTAQYETVGNGSTGHAESVQVTFDPRQISYGQILRIYFSVTLDPTQLNRQGPDAGTQYRSVIFATDTQQAKVATAYVKQLEAAHVFNAPIVTEVDPLKAFYTAEAYHQDFLARHPTYPYIVINDLPKVRNLKQVFPTLYRPDPVLVTNL